MSRTISVIAILLATVASCMPSSVPTEQEARAFLDRVVGAVNDGDIAGLCALSNCMPDDRLPFQAPADPPTIVGTRVIPTTSIPGGGESLGGQVLELCGIGPDSMPYRFEMLVFRADGQLHTPTYKYWQNMTVSGGSQATTPAGRASPVNCPAA
jgi:hypothetical protein